MSQPSSQTHVYGPVPSRRLGLSLGVDLLPRKVCCFDCIYCQVGPTTRLTAEPEDFGVSVPQVVEQIQQALAREPRTRVITLAGSGEPTLYAPLEQLVSAVREICDLPLVLLTNGGLLWRPEVARAAGRFDQVYPSLDAADAQTLSRMNRPAPGLELERMLGGLESFCAGFAGRCRLEVMLVRGVNDSPASLQALARVARTLNIEGVDLNTVVRPPAHDAGPLSRRELLLAAERFAPLDVEIIARFAAADSGGLAPTARTAGQILQMTARRPCTAEDIAGALGLDPDALSPFLDQMVDRGELRQERDHYRPTRS